MSAWFCVKLFDWGLILHLLQLKRQLRSPGVCLSGDYAHVCQSSGSKWGWRYISEGSNSRNKLVQMRKSVYSMILCISTNMAKVSLFRVHEISAFYARRVFWIFARFFEFLQPSFIFKQIIRIFSELWYRICSFDVLELQNFYIVNI